MCRRRRKSPEIKSIVAGTVPHAATNYTPQTWENYRIQRNMVVGFIRKAKKDYYVKLNIDLSNPRTCSKKWWGISKSLFRNKYYSPMPDLLVNGDIISDTKQKADSLNEYFTAQTQIPNDTNSPIPLVSLSTHSLSVVETDELEVLNLLSNVDISKACGLDNISNRIIKLCAIGIHKPFTRLLNTSFRLGQYPNAWKFANVIPLFKKDNRQVRSNYRPISLLVNLSKICEKIVFMRLYNFLENCGFFYRFQSGFRPCDSTVMQLIYIVNKIYNALERGNEVRAVFLDISKAFDRVWHKGLIAKLRSIGINGSLLLWFESYLTGRQQRVIIEGTSSEWKNIKAGVPQGSVLGPLLFLIYINDIATNISSDCFLFADDSLLMEEVISPVDSANKLNNDLSTISAWSNQWLITMNPEKTETMIFTCERDKPFHPPLYMTNTTIRDVTSHEHLGVTLALNLSWRPHILKIHQKASKKLNMLKPLKFILKRKTLDVLYKSLVRSCLDYADIIWDGCTETDSDLLEKLQIDAARLVTGAIKERVVKVYLRKQLGLSSDPDALIISFL